MKMTRAEAVAAVAEQVTPLAEHGGDRKSEDSKSTLRRNVEQQGNSKEYRTAKLARDAPEVVERMKAGEFRNMAEAERAAGVVRRQDNSTQTAIACARQ